MFEEPDAHHRLLMTILSSSVLAWLVCEMFMIAQGDSGVPLLAKNYTFVKSIKRIQVMDKRHIKNSLER